MFDRDRLIDSEDDWRSEPFRHAIIDDLWDPWRLRQFEAEFPAYGDPRWLEYDNPDERGKKAGGPGMWGPQTRNFFDLVRSSDFCSLLEKSTGIDNLTGDDVGGGMHITGDGGRLGMHVDFNVHPTLPLERRLNMLVFLNHEWDRNWGGVLYLGADREIEVMPMFNRTVIFECSEKSFHGHPDPVVGHHLRRSLACYYYAPLRAETAPAHTTIFTR